MAPCILIQTQKKSSTSDLDYFLTKINLDGEVDWSVRFGSDYSEDGGKLGTTNMVESNGMLYGSTQSYAPVDGSYYLFTPGLFRLSPSISQCYESDLSIENLNTSSIEGATWYFADIDDSVTYFEDLTTVYYAEEPAAEGGSCDGVCNGAISRITTSSSVVPERSELYPFTIGESLFN